MKNGLFFETLTRTRYTKRWYEQKPVFEDNVSTHSFRVAMFSLIAAELERKKYGNEVDIEQVICGAIFHDMNEVLTSTIKHGTKKNEKVKELVILLEKEKNEEMVSWLSEKMQPKFKKYFMEAENRETIEGRIVDEMDAFDAMMFCYREIKEGNNTPFFQITFDKLKNKMKQTKLESVKMMLSAIDLKNDLYHFMYKIMSFSNIDRWMGRKNNIIDNDAIHTMTATAIGIFFAVYENHFANNENKINIGRMAAKIICHDVPEIETGDIRGPVKHSSKELQQAFAKIEEEEAEKMVQLLPKEIREVFKDYMIDAKSEDPEGYMVEVSDKVEALVKSTLELRDNEFEYRITHKQQKEKIQREFQTKSVEFFLMYILHDLLDEEIVQI